MIRNRKYKRQVAIIRGLDVQDTTETINDKIMVIDNALSTHPQFYSLQSQERMTIL